jgi:hypothetical protein
MPLAQARCFYIPATEEDERRKKQAFHGSLDSHLACDCASF